MGELREVLNAIVGIVMALGAVVGMLTVIGFLVVASIDTLRDRRGGT